MAVRKDKIQIEVEINGKKAGGTVRELRKTARQLKRELDGLAPGTEAFVKKAAELRKVNTQLAQVNAQTRGVKKGLDEMNRLPGIFRGIGGALKAIGILALIDLTVQGARALVGIGKESLQLYNTQAQAEAQLARALEGNIEAADRLKAKASELQGVTLFGDEAIIQQQAFLASLQFSEEEINKVIPAAVDMSAALGISLESAVKNLAKTYSGLTGELGESIPQLRGLTTEQLKAGEATGLLAEQFAGAAAAQAEADTTSTQLRNKIGDLQEVVGRLIDRGIKLLRPAFEGLVDITFGFVEGLVDGKKATGDFSGVINTAVAVVRGFWNILREGYALFFAIPAALRQVGENTMATFEELKLGAQEFTQELQLAFTFDKKKEEALRQDIKRLKRLRLEAAASGKSVGEAFAEARQKALAGGIDTAPQEGTVAQNAAGINTSPGSGAEGGKQIKAAFKAREAEIKAGHDREILLLEGQLLRQEVREQEAAQRRLEIQEKFYQDQLGLLERYGRSQENQYLEIENKLTENKIKQEEAEYLRREQATISTVAALAQVAVKSEAEKGETLLRVEQLNEIRSEQLQKDFLQRRKENQERAAEIERTIEEAKISLKEEFFNTALGLLAKDQEARRKNASAIKAFETGRILVDGIKEIQGIFAGYASLGPIGAAVAVGRAALAGIRTAQAIKKVQSQKFSSGGGTGPGILPADETGERPAGIVHAWEWVAPRWMTQHPQHSQTINYLERIRLRGFAGGGFTTQDTSPQGELFQAPGALSQAGGDNGATDRLEGLLEILIAKTDKPKPAILKREDLLTLEEEDAFTVARAGF